MKNEKITDGAMQKSLHLRQTRSSTMLHSTITKLTTGELFNVKPTWFYEASFGSEKPLQKKTKKTSYSQNKTKIGFAKLFCLTNPRSSYGNHTPFCKASSLPQKVAKPAVRFAKPHRFSETFFFVKKKKKKVLHSHI